MESGDIVYLTKHYDEWIRMLNSDLDIPLMHRVAKIVKIFNWETEEGKLLLQQRISTKKWDKLNSEDFKYVIKVYYPDLINKKSNKPGIHAIEVLPLKYPGTEFSLFEVYPKHLLDDLNSPVDKDVFTLKRKEF